MSDNQSLLPVLKDTVQDGNLNFLIGSGLSMPFLGLLGNIEELLTELDARQDITPQKKKLISAALYKRYADEIIFKNVSILDGEAATLPVLDTYKAFLRIVNSVLLNRKNPILSKQANIFTTNIDIYLEKALEDLGLEYSDGFSGRFSPVFNLSNFRKSTYTKSLHFDNKSEVPVFNLLKLHGSLTWAVDAIGSESRIKFSPDLALVRQIKDQDFTEIIAAQSGEGIDDLKAAAESRRVSPTTESFLRAYNGLPIINPTKDKFKLTLLNQIHYEMLRMYANELEKENTVLFALGFSFSDEHIREITLRAVNSNPTLTVYVVAHSSSSKAHFEAKLGLANLKNRNIKIIAPEVKKPEEGGGDAFAYDFPTIVDQLFLKLLKMTEHRSDHYE